VAITGSGTTNSTLDITGIRTNSAVNPPRGTISLYYPGADGATANVHGASIMFSQRYNAVEAAPIGIGMIAGVKVNPGGNFGGGLTFWTSNQTNNNLAERMRIDASGSVGIGLTSPTALVHISGSSLSASLFRVSSTSNNNALVVSGSGFVGLGALTPSGALHINSNNFNTATSTSIFITDHGNNTGDGNVAARIQFQSRYWGSDDTVTSAQSAIVHGKAGSSGNGGSFLAFHTTTRNSGAIFERVRISSDGVGIFKTSPSASLDVSGSMLVTGSFGMTGSFTQNGFVTLTRVSQSLNYADDVAAAAGGVPLGGLYRNGNFVLIRLS
jgi:hypothetical protein